MMKVIWFETTLAIKIKSSLVSSQKGIGSGKEANFTLVSIKLLNGSSQYIEKSILGRRTI
jgi:hypothetical protein